MTIRNLTLSGRSDGRKSSSLDDEALSPSLSTPAKLISKQEHWKLEPIRSSTDLTAINEWQLKNERAQGLQNGRFEEFEGTTPKTPARPSSRRLRRRSTMEWVNASPAARQKKLENVTNTRLMDTFYSLHVEMEKDPIYVSEIVEHTMNPTFQSLSLAGCSSKIMRSDKLIIKVWIRQNQKLEFECLLEMGLEFQCLQYMGKTLDNIRYSLPQNCVLFHMTDGIYTVIGEGLASPPPELIRARQPNGSKVLPTSSYEALIRLSNLDASIQDALTTRQRLEQDINNLLEFHENNLTMTQSVGMAEQAAIAMDQAVQSERRRLDAMTKKRNAIKDAIKSRQVFILQGREDMSHERLTMKRQQDHVGAMNEASNQTSSDIVAQRRRICDGLQKVFPIEPVLGHALAFTIRGVPLPNSNFSSTDDETVAAALGYVAQLVHFLSLYLSIPLPYIPEARGSTSTITDSISSSMTGSASAIYPLYTQGVPRFRFEYAVFLLNKDIQLLAARLSLRIVDVRHTLPNLKYLLCVLSSQGFGFADSIRSVPSMRNFLHETTSGTSSRRDSIDATVNIGEAFQSLGNALAASRLRDRIPVPHGSTMKAETAKEHSNGTI